MKFLERMLSIFAVIYLLFYGLTKDSSQWGLILLSLGFAFALALIIRANDTERWFD